MAGPLQNIKVLDLSRVLAGPWATQLLADYGAEVIKIERPQVGDDTRQWGPPYLKDQAGQETSESAYYLSTNRGKKSVAVDITQAEGQQLVRDLAKSVDVVIENFKVGGLKRYGLDYESLAKENPALIYCSITGFGQTGPFASHAGYDAMIQGMGGLMSITGVPDGLPGAGPMKTGVAVADLMTGMYAVSAILSALYYRDNNVAQSSQAADDAATKTEEGSKNNSQRATEDKPRKGQYIDLSLLDTQVAWLANQGMNYLCTGENPTRRGNGHPNIVPYQAIETADGHIMLAVGNDEQFLRLCDLAGCADLALLSSYATNAARVKNRDALIKLLAVKIVLHDSSWWLKELEEKGIPCGPINSIAEALDHPQIKHRGMAVKLPHPLAGEMTAIKNPVVYSATPTEPPTAPPLLGQHTSQVLKEILHLSDAKIAELKAKGIID